MRLVFLDVDDTILDPPYDAVKKAAEILGCRNFPTLSQIQSRQHVDIHASFPEVFKSKNHMWCLAFAGIPFGLTRSQKICAGIDQMSIQRILSDHRVILLSKNPPFLKKSRKKRIQEVFGVDVGNRYIPCGPVFGKAPSKSTIIEAFSALYNVSPKDCLLVDDHPRHIVEASKIGVQTALVDCTWNSEVEGPARISRSEIPKIIDSFLGPTKSIKQGSCKVTLDTRVCSANTLTKSLLLKIKNKFLSKNTVGLEYKIFNYESASLRTQSGFEIPFYPKFAQNLSQIRSAIDKLNPGNSPALDEYNKNDLINFILSEAKHDYKALKYAKELASGRTKMGMLVLQKFLNCLSTFTFRRVKVAGGETLSELSKTHFLIFLPHHRSIYDSALLMKVIYEQTGTMPITPAALKMKKNLIGAGGQLIGSFYIQRKRVDETYSQIMTRIVEFATKNSSSAAIFIEGQRSRRGLPLKPKSGLFRIFLEKASEGDRPLAIVPMSFAYNKLPEAEVLFDEVYEEITGKVGQCTRDKSNMLIRKLTSKSSVKTYLDRLFRSRTSDAYVSFGKPVIVENSPIANLRQTVSQVLNETMVQTNCIVPPLSTSLASLAILAQKEQHLSGESLVRFLNFSNLLIPTYPGAIHRSFKAENTNDFFTEINRLPFINRKFKRHGIQQSDYVSITDLDFVLASHYKNNVIHYFALPGLLAKIVIAQPNGSISDIRGEFYRHAPDLVKRFFISPSLDLQIYFEKLLSLFKLMSFINFDSVGSIQLNDHSEESVFNLLAEIGTTATAELDLNSSAVFTRTNDRFSISIPVKLRFSDDSSTIAPARVTNLSKTGGAIQTDKNMSIGDILELVFDEKDEKEGIKRVEIVRLFSKGFGFRFTTKSDSRQATTNKAA